MECNTIKFIGKNNKEICNVDELGIWIIQHSWNSDPKTTAQLLFENFEVIWSHSFSFDEKIDRQVIFSCNNKKVIKVMRDSIEFHPSLIIPDYYTEKSINLLQKMWKDSSTKI